MSARSTRFITIAILGLVIATITVRYFLARRVRNAIDGLGAHGLVSVMYSEGTVSYDSKSTTFYFFHRVTGIEFAGGVFEAKDAEAITSAMQLTELSLSFCGVVRPAFAHLETLDRLERLQLVSVQVVDDEVFLGDSPPDTVSSNRQRYNEIMEGTAAHWLGDNDLAFLRRLPRLTHLVLANADVSTEGVRHLTALRRLEVLNLSNTLVGDAGVVALCEACPSLRRLDLDGIGLRHGDDTFTLTDEAVEAICRLRGLQMLDISHSLVTRRSLEVLAAMESLKELTLEDCINLTVSDLNQFRSQRPDILLRPTFAEGVEEDRRLGDRAVMGGIAK
jgi:Leucine-rich repeat (LRR) protein